MELCNDRPEGWVVRSDLRRANMVILEGKRSHSDETTAMVDHIGVM